MFVHESSRIGGGYGIGNLQLVIRVHNHFRGNPGFFDEYRINSRKINLLALATVDKRNSGHDVLLLDASVGIY